MSLAEQQWKILEYARRQRHVAAGEDAAIGFERLSGTNTPTVFLPIERAWEYGDKTFEGKQLPAEVPLELRISEVELAADAFTGTCSILHGDRRFGVISPSPFAPAGVDRFWRFWIAPKEDED